jgi:predicted AAA+ superfamily ATPase
VLVGPRQVGKTTLVREVLEGHDFLFLDGDDPLIRSNLTEYFLYPVSYEEYEHSSDFLTASGDLTTRLVFGFYPEVIDNRGEEMETLNEITQNYLYKDILALGNLRKPEALESILRALAFQVGSEVSLNEISRLTGTDKNRVSRYIRLLELSYIIYPLTTFSRNLRNEIKATRKIYFYDNGIRNAIIQNFNPMELRNDVGALCENFLISERLKTQGYHRQFANRYFWRTTAGQQIDYVEEAGGKIFGYEFKWNPKAKTKIPSSFADAYSADVRVITRDNYRNFVALP